MDSTMQVGDISNFFGTPQRHGGAFQVCSTPLDGHCIECFDESDEDNESFLKTIDDFLNSTALTISSDNSGTAYDDTTLKIGLAKAEDEIVLPTASNVPTQTRRARRLSFVRECSESTGHNAVEENTEAGHADEDDNIVPAGSIAGSCSKGTQQLGLTVHRDIEVGNAQRCAVPLRPAAATEYGNSISTVRENELPHINTEAFVPTVTTGPDHRVSFADSASIIVRHSQTPCPTTSTTQLTNTTVVENCVLPEVVCVQSIADDHTFMVVDEVDCTDDSESAQPNAGENLTRVGHHNCSADRHADTEVDNVTCNGIESIQSSDTSTVLCAHGAGAAATGDTMQAQDTGLCIRLPIAVVSPVRQLNSLRSLPTSLEPIVLEGEQSDNVARDVSVVEVKHAQRTKTSCTVGEANTAAAAVGSAEDAVHDCSLIKDCNTFRAPTPDEHRVSHDVGNAAIPDSVSGDLTRPCEPLEDKGVASEVTTSDGPNLIPPIALATPAVVSKHCEESFGELNMGGSSVDRAAGNSVVSRMPTTERKEPHTVIKPAVASAAPAKQKPDGTDLTCSNSVSTAGGSSHNLVKGESFLPENNRDCTSNIHIDWAYDNGVAGSIPPPGKGRRYVTFGKPGEERYANNLSEECSVGVSAPCVKPRSTKSVVNILTKEDKGEDMKVNTSTGVGAELPNKNAISNVLRASQGKPSTEAIQSALEEETRDVGGAWPQDRRTEKPSFKVMHSSTESILQKSDAVLKVGHREPVGKEKQSTGSKIPLRHKPTQKDSTSHWLFHSKEQERTTRKVKVEKGRSQAKNNSEKPPKTQDGEGDILLVTLESDDVRVVEGDAVDDVSTVKPPEYHLRQMQECQKEPELKAEPECLCETLVEQAVKSTDLRHKINSMRNTVTSDSQSGEVTATRDKLPLDTNQNAASKRDTPVKTECLLTDTLQEIEGLIPVKVESAEPPSQPSERAAEILQSVPPRPPFFSDDPEENYDNANPGWENFRQLSTDEERYEAVRNVWHNARIPDPHRNLSQYKHKQRKLQHQPTKGRTRRQKRKAPSSSVENPAAKRKRLDTDIFDLKLKELERKTNKDYNAAQHWLELNIQRVREQVNSQLMFLNYGGHNRTTSAPWDMRYWQQHQEELLHYKYMTDTQNIRNNYSARASKLLDARHEVRHFNKFYVGLCGTDPTMLSELQMKEQLKIEKLLGHFKMYYLDAKE
ncbi:uncharacterized protein LOC135388358 [Ornithodoros turicata]|uniref:uncharacterized protein LOC135388358 n=1 Tax=Ornithodoros turicata TaxID=34597 RepID=UPI0031397C0A